VLLGGQALLEFREIRVFRVYKAPKETKVYRV